MAGACCALVFQNTVDEWVEGLTAEQLELSLSSTARHQPVHEAQHPGQEAAVSSRHQTELCRENAQNNIPDVCVVLSPHGGTVLPSSHSTNAHVAMAAPMERSNKRYLGTEVGYVNTMWSIPASQLHLRHCVGRILPVQMYQISDSI